METTYTVSARKYRPQRFEAVVGQQHITETLENAVKKGHMAQAMLFCGPRGVGKTTCARILARLINEVHTGPDLDYSLNIFELDAASNNSVEDIRQLIEQVRFAPQVGKFKVYIIDEVHMLSSAAFNAFLKTLEEPPRHAIFILATTEKHKVLPTILSRCQIFDFKRIGVEDIAKHLAFVASKEGIVAEPEALHMIAQKADGALRDSLSIFDRIAAFSSGDITYASVVENLQILDYDVYFNVVDKFKANDVPGVLLDFHDVLSKGFDAHLFLVGLTGHVRDVLMAHHPSTVHLLEVPDSVKRRYAEQAQTISAGFLARAMKRLTECESKYKQSYNPRLQLEVALIELADGMALNGEDVEKKKPTNESLVAAARPQNPVGLSPVPPAPSVPSAPPVPPVQRVDSATPDPVTEAISESLPESISESFPESISEALPEKPKTPSVNTSRRIRSAFSLSDALVESSVIPSMDSETGAGTSAGSKRNTAYTSNALQIAWREYVETLKDRPAVFNIVNPMHISANADHSIPLVVSNTIQQSYLERERDSMLSFLRNRMENDGISVVFTVERSAAQKVVYTPEERFAYLVEKNPHLVEFRREFELDIE